MIGAIRHRGPDEFGVFIDDWAALGHARLSIIDLAGGCQPIHNEDKTLWIIYNGEVFNYPELREDLLARGHRFSTSTDTEVILHLYEERGPTALDELNGQFALAIWDSRRRELFLARDRVGIRPLHYTMHQGSLLFASEIKALMTHPGVERNLDPSALDQSFTYWTTLPGQTAFAGIEELPPGHYLSFSDKGLSIKKFWDIPCHPPEEQLDWPVEELCEQARELLRDATRIRLRADVPVGCYLSGGLDSSGVTALVAGRSGGAVSTYGIRFEDEHFDEGQYQRQMVEQLQVAHHEMQATNAAIAAHFPEVIWHSEKPLLRTAPTPLFLLSRLVRDSGYKVVLTGEGADEVFGGYNIFREAKVRRFWASQPASALRPLLIGRLYPYIFKKSPELRRMEISFFGRGFAQVEDPFYSHAIRWQNTSRIKTFLSPDIAKRTNPERDREALQSMLPDNFDRLDYLAKAQCLEIMLFMSNYLLSSQGDRVAMAHSVEIRLPYLDKRIIEFMSRVPSKWKIRGMDEKHLLKRVFEGIVPETIRQRPKHPYRAPIGSMLTCGAASEPLREMLTESRLKAAGLFDSAKVNRLVQKVSKRTAPSEMDAMALAGILSTQILHEQFVAGFPARPIEPVRPNIVFDRTSRKQLAQAHR